MKDLPFEELQLCRKRMMCWWADAREPLRVCYLRHAYELGEHYNSVGPFEEEEYDMNSDHSEAGSDEKPLTCEGETCDTMSS